MMQMGTKKTSEEGWSLEAKKTSVRFLVGSSMALYRLCRKDEQEETELSCCWGGWLSVG